MRELSAHALALVVAWVPGSASACPVCQDPSAQDTSVFLSMTIFMSLLPLTLIGGTVYYLVRASRSAPRCTAAKMDGPAMADAERTPPMSAPPTPALQTSAPVR